LLQLRKQLGLDGPVVAEGDVVVAGEAGVVLDGVVHNQVVEADVAEPGLLEGGEEAGRVGDHWDGDVGEGGGEAGVDVVDGLDGGAESGRGDVFAVAW